MVRCWYCFRLLLRFGIVISCGWFVGCWLCDIIIFYGLIFVISDIVSLVIWYDCCCSDKLVFFVNGVIKVEKFEFCLGVYVYEG